MEKGVRKIQEKVEGGRATIREVRETGRDDSKKAGGEGVRCEGERE